MRARRLCKRLLFMCARRVGVGVRMASSWSPQRVAMASSLLLLPLALLCWLHWGRPDTLAPVGGARRTNRVDVRLLQVQRPGPEAGRAGARDVPPSVDCSGEPQTHYPFCDPTLSPAARASDLLSRLTLKEVIAQTSSIAPAVPRLGLRAYNWRSNCLHGWAASGGHWLHNLTWTVFPAPIGLGATFDVNLVNAIGRVTADEGRALHNVMLGAFEGASTEAAGLNCFSPNVNLFRDPRWGRGQETFGEDPVLISLIGAAYTRGLQEGEDPRYLKVAACAKHFAVHSGPEELRLRFSANVTLHDLYDTYLPAFKSQVLGAGVAQMMPAYSGLRCPEQEDGAPDAANLFLLRTVLRGQFAAPNISVCSDNGAVMAVYSEQKYTSDLEEAAAACMNASTDLDLGHDLVYPKFLPAAIADKKTTEEAVREAVWRSFVVRMRVGDFDSADRVSYQSINASHLNTHANQQLNLHAARKSIVLLKNDGNFLPLKLNGIQRIAVIGPNANASTTLLSNYQGIPPSITTVLQGIKEAVRGSGVEVVHAAGCSSVKCPDRSALHDAQKVAADADYVVMVMGLDSTVEGEGHDRANTTCEGEKVPNLWLPGCQGAVLAGVAGVAPLNSSNTVVVLINGGPVSLGGTDPASAYPGVIEAFYPGPMGGVAVADILFGRYSPGGRMPVTVYQNASTDVPPSVDYSMSAPPGRTYRYFTRASEFAFGFGLSYTKFTFSSFSLNPSVVNPCDPLKVELSFSNTGGMAGDEVILVFLYLPKDGFGHPTFPRVQLAAFERVSLDPGAGYVARFTLDPYVLSLVSDDGNRYIFAGDYLLEARGANDIASQIFSILGPATTRISDCPSAAHCFAC